MYSIMTLHFLSHENTPSSYSKETLLIYINLHIHKWLDCYLLLVVQWTETYVWMEFTFIEIEKKVTSYVIKSLFTIIFWRRKIFWLLTRWYSKKPHCYVFISNIQNSGVYTYSGPLWVSSGLTHWMLQDIDIFVYQHLGSLTHFHFPTGP